MDRMPPRSQEALLEIGVRTVVDLRTTRETQEQPNVFAQSSDVTFLHFNMMGDEPFEESSVADEGGETADRILQSYSTFLDRRQPQIAQILAAMAEPEACPVVFHCAGGKDRTGIIAALLLEIAGTPRSAIAEDYGDSAKHLMERYFAEQAEPGVSEDNYTWRDYQSEYCPPEAMERVLSYVDRKYNGAIRYAQVIGLNSAQIDRLRDAMLGSAGGGNR
jgi:protein-tyrosine phosphatase